MRSCTEYEALISAFIDDALAEEERGALMEHMAVCPRCQAYFNDQIAIHDAIHPMEETAAPADFTSQVMEQIHSEKSAAKKVIPFPRWRQWAAMAACCAVAVGLLAFGGMGGQVAPGGAATPTSKADARAIQTEAAPQEASLELPSDAPAQYNAVSEDTEGLAAPQTTVADAAPESSYAIETAVVRTHSDVAKHWVEDTLGQTWESGRSYELTRAQYEELCQLLNDAESDSGEITSMRILPVTHEVERYLLEAE